MNNIYYLIPHLADACLLWIFFRNTLGKTKKVEVPVLCGFFCGKELVGFLVERFFLIKYLNHPQIGTLLFGVFTTFLISFCFFSSNRKRIIYSVVYQTLVLFSEITFPFFVSLINQRFLDIPDTSWLDTVLITGSKLVLLILCIAMVHLQKNKDAPIEYTLLLFVTPVISLCIHLYIPLREIGRTGDNGFYELAVTGLLVINFVNYAIIQRTRSIFALKSENERMEQEIRLQRDKYVQLSESYKQMRRILHDTKKHYFSIREYASKDASSELMNYLARATEELESTYVKYNVGNLVMDSMLTFYDSVAEKKQIQFDVTLHVDNKRIPLEDYDLSIVLGNLLDNAVEACVKMTGEKRWIRIAIETTENNKFVIRCENTYERFSNMSQNSIEHGYGLRNIKKTVERNHGFMTYEMGDTFVMVIWIPILQDEKEPEG